MNSRERICAAVAFEEVDRPPFDLFDEAGYVFTEGRYDPAQRLFMTYEEQVRARVRFHREFHTDLIFDAPVLIPTRMPCKTRLLYEGEEIRSPEKVMSYTTAMAWNPMPAKVKGNGLLPDDASGEVRKEVAWENGVRSVEVIDLATGTSDCADYPFSNAAEILDNLDCIRGDMERANYSLLRTMRTEVGGDVLLSGTITDPVSMIGAYIGVEKLMYLLMDDERVPLSVCEKLMDIAVETGVSMAEHGIDMIRLGAATACVLSPDLFEKYCIPFQRPMIEAIQKKGAIVHLHLCGNVQHLLDLIPETGAAVLETITPPPLGDTTMEQAKETAGRKICLKGNLSPTGALQHGDPGQAVAEARACVQAGSRGSGFIFSVADCMAPGTPEANVRSVADYLTGL